MEDFSLGQKSKANEIDSLTRAAWFCQDNYFKRMNRKIVRKTILINWIYKHYHYIWLNNKKIFED